MGKRLRADGALRLEAEWCVDRGIPWSQFCGWPQEDQDLVAAVLELRQQTCDRCGTRSDEWGTYDENGVLQPLDRPAWKAKTSKCLGCERIDNRYGEFKQGAPPGVRVVLTRNV